VVRSVQFHVERITAAISASSLFLKPPVVEFASQRTACLCGKPLLVSKTRTRVVSTLEIGQFQAHETLVTCRQCDAQYGSEELSKCVPRSCNFGFDVIEYVGRALFLRCRNEQEIQAELKEKNIAISIRGIGYLARKFVIYLAIVHRQSRDAIKHLLTLKGGYILHLDGTCEGDSPHLTCALDSISEIVLGSIKTPSESAKEITPLLKRIEQDYGEPLAVVRDMGQGIAGAVHEVFPKVAEYICHFHFLRDVGNDLLEKENASLRKALKPHRHAIIQLSKELKRTIDLDPELNNELNLCKSKPQEILSLTLHPKVFTYALLLWIQDARSELDGYGFPFDRAHLLTFKRIKMMHEHLKHYRVKQACPQFERLLKILQQAVLDSIMHQAVTAMQKRVEVFEKLRAAMRIAQPQGKRGLNCSGDNTDIKTIKQKVTDFRQDQQLIRAAENSIVYQKLLAQIDKYWDKLFADPITVNTPQGKITLQPQRTNNILEQFFRKLKKQNRRKGGMQSMTKFLKATIADSPLVSNLRNQSYLDVILAGQPTLAARFAQINARLVQKEIKTKDLHRVPLKLRKVLRSGTFLEKFLHNAAQVAVH